MIVREKDWCIAQPGAVKALSKVFLSFKQTSIIQHFDLSSRHFNKRQTILAFRLILHAFAAKWALRLKGRILFDRTMCRHPSD
jgi:hypothetical protein